MFPPKGSVLRTWTYPEELGKFLHISSINLCLLLYLWLSPSLKSNPTIFQIQINIVQLSCFCKNFINIIIESINWVNQSFYHFLTFLPTHDSLWFTKKINHFTTSWDGKLDLSFINRKVFYIHFWKFRYISLNIE